MLGQQLLQRPERPEGALVLLFLALLGPGGDRFVGGGEVFGRQGGRSRGAGFLDETTGDLLAQLLCAVEHRLGRVGIGHLSNLAWIR